MKDRLAVLAILFSSLLAPGLWAQGAKEKTTVPQLVSRLNKSAADLEAAANKALKGRSPVERPFRASLKELQAATAKMPGQLQAKDPGFGKSLKSAGRSVAGVTAAWSALGVKDPAVDRALEALQESYTALNKRAGAAALAGKKAGPLTPAQKARAAKMKAEAGRLQERLAVLTARQKPGSPTAKMLGRLQAQAKAASVLDVVSGAAYSTLLGLIDILGNNYYAVGSVLQVRDPGFYREWNTMAPILTTIEETYTIEESYEETAFWAYAEESFEADYSDDSYEELDAMDEDLDEITPEDHADTATDEDAADAADDGGDEAADDGGSDATDDGGDEATDDGGSDAKDDGGDEAADDGGSDATDDGGDEATDDGGSDATDDGGDEATDDGGSDATDDGGDEAADDGGSDAADDGGDDGGGDDSGGDDGGGDDGGADDGGGEE